MKTTALIAMKDKGEKLTPMMEQYLEMKLQQPDAILFFRMGDFYELFFEDAITVSKELNITQTHRGKINGEPIPMAGIPHHAAANYVDRLTSIGYRVAIGEQIQNPKDAKGVVKRAIVQIASRGIPYDIDKANEKESHYISTINIENNDFSVVTVDFTTGNFFGQIAEDESRTIEIIESLAPKEIICHFDQFKNNVKIEEAINLLGIQKTVISEEYFDLKYSIHYIQKMIPSFDKDQTIQNRKILHPALAATSFFLFSTQQCEKLGNIRPFRIINTEELMGVSAQTLKGLEILPRSPDNYKNSILGLIDQCKCAMGSRKLKTMLLSPLKDKNKIEQRLDVITYLYNDQEKIEYLRDNLSKVRDIERILAKLSNQKITPNDLVNLKNTIRAYELILKNEKKGQLKKITELLTKKDHLLIHELAGDIEESISEELGAHFDKGNLIKDGFNKERDRLKSLSQNAKKTLVEMENRYKAECDIPKLRIKSNNVFGYYIEVPKGQVDKVPQNYIRRQTLVNVERYTTEELSNFEKEIVTAKERLESLERELFKDQVKNIEKCSKSLLQLSDVIAQIDSYQSLAYMANLEGLTRPKFNSEKKIELKGAFHPLIKKTLLDNFVTHDLTLNSKGHFGLITGPNMAGKTTLMREVAIIQLLAQIGSFVPALKANIPVVDYLFSRLGASDDILRGHSTFMVEMAETAEIVRHATENSLIILDEIGRGTSTYDGLSIAWALLEHLVSKVKALGLFATHYHELIDVAEKLDGAKNFTVETKVDKDNVQFLYNLVEKGATQSFGIYVARLAGVDKSILKRSENILKELETEENKRNNLSNQLSLFDIIEPVKKENIADKQTIKFSEIQKDIKSVDLSNIRPIEALMKLDKYQQELLN